jgi:hypothetical protein
MMRSKLQYYRGKEDNILGQCLSMDTESIRRVTQNPLESAEMPSHPTWLHTDVRDFNKHKERIVALSGVVMKGASDPQKAQIALGSFPNFDAPEPINELELVEAFHQTSIGFQGNKQDLTDAGVDLQKVSAIIKNSGFLMTAWPVIVGANINEDLQRLYVVAVRIGYASMFAAYPPDDRAVRQKHSFSDESDWSGQKVDILKFTRGGKYIQDKVTLQQFAIDRGLPGKYYPYKDEDVESLWRKGDMEAIIEYNRVDSLLVHFLNLSYLCFDGVISKDQFHVLWDRSAKLLEENAHPERDVGLKWFLKKLPDAIQVSKKIIRVEDRNEADFKKHFE